MAAGTTLRMRYQKLGKVRFTSHRDVARLVERALRRVEVPVARSEGFVPRPKLHFGLALPTCAESVAEYLDVDLRVGADHVDLDALPGLLSDALPPGLDITAAGVLEGKVTSLQAAVVACTWSIEIEGITPGDLEAWAARLLAADEVPVTRERKGKEITDDLRPALLDLRSAGPRSEDRTPGAVLEAELGTQPRGVRPTELLSAGTPALEAALVCRLHQWIELDGARQEPLPAATGAPHAEVRAS